MAGWGHVMRCLALARALRDKGTRVAFAMPEVAGSSADRVVEAGFPVFAVPAEAGSALSPADLEAVTAVMRRFRVDTVLVDHYGAGPAYLGALRARGWLVAVIDDLESRDLRAAHWILNQNLGARPSVAGLGAIRLAGPRFALLRPEFAEARASLRRPARSGDGRLLLTLGGGNTWPTARRVLQALERALRPVEVRCIVGGVAPPEIQAFEVPGRITFLGPVDDIVTHMRWSDLSVNAGGTTCWELMCLGVPMVVLPLSRDQLPNAVAIGAAGSGRILPPERLSELAALVDALLGDPAGRAEMAATSMRLVDGRGAERAADSLLELADGWSGEERHAVG
jgi:spore coat polysaccharide biosynthesis predicted glycosyltransferase SpsG